jgi:hypothetical protein
MEKQASKIYINRHGLKLFVFLISWSWSWPSARFNLYSASSSSLPFSSSPFLCGLSLPDSCSLSRFDSSPSASGDWERDLASSDFDLDLDFEASFSSASLEPDFERDRFGDLDLERRRRLGDLDLDLQGQKWQRNLRARKNVPNVLDHSDRQSRLFPDQIKIWPIRSILPSFAKYAIKYTSEQEV